MSPDCQCLNLSSLYSYKRFNHSQCAFVFDSNMLNYLEIRNLSLVSTNIWSSPQVAVGGS